MFTYIPNIEREKKKNFLFLEMEVHHLRWQGYPLQISIIHNGEVSNDISIKIRNTCYFKYFSLF